MQNLTVQPIREAVRALTADFDSRFSFFVPGECNITLVE